MTDLDPTDAILWTLRKDERTATAAMRVIRDFGVELRVLYNESFRVGRLYSDVAAVLADATERRSELESRGWSPVCVSAGPPVS
jgi:hypothetical protein